MSNCIIFQRHKFLFTVSDEEDEDEGGIGLDAVYKDGLEVSFVYLLSLKMMIKCFNPFFIFHFQLFYNCAQDETDEDDYMGEEEEEDDEDDNEEDEQDEEEGKRNVHFQYHAF